MMKYEATKEPRYLFFCVFFFKSNIKWIDAYINDVKPFKLYTLFYDYNMETKTKSKKKKIPKKK